MARMIRAGSPSRALIVVGSDAPEDRARELAGTGATVVRCRTRDARLDLGAVLDDLFAREVRGVLVERVIVSIQLDLPDLAQDCRL